MARTTEGLTKPAEELARIVAGGWQGTAAQANQLAVLLRAMLEPAQLVALGEVWEVAVADLAAHPVPLTRTAARHLVGSWLRVGANRADEWRRPRHQRAKNGRLTVRPSADITVMVARWGRS
jgi:hypothetical protein